MPLANFFQKSAAAASHVLKDFDIEAFSAHLEKHNVGLFFAEKSIRTIEGQITCELTVNLLARLYPRITICSDGGDTHQEVKHLTSIAYSINPEIEISDNPTDVTHLLIVGESVPDTKALCFYVGSNGWLAHFSPDRPVGSNNSNNPLGACAAACFGSANVFRSIFKAQLDSEIDSEFSISLLNYRKNDEAKPRDFPATIDLGTIHLVGAGAVGNACLWTLEKFTNLTGTLHVIDKESIADTNLQRYLLTTQASVGKVKVDVAHEHFKKSTVMVVPHHHSWQSYINRTSNYIVEHAVVALDTSEDRIAVQASLPKRITNAWTQPADLGISRHEFGDGNACLACLYIPDREVPGYAEVVAKELGLPWDDPSVRTLLYTGNPVGQDFVNKVTALNPQAGDRLRAFADKPLQTFHSQVICGSTIMRDIGDSNHRGDSETPMAFQSALAGVLLASELVISSSNLRTEQLPTVTSINLLDSIGDELSYPRKPHPRGSCICQDNDYIMAYDQKFFQAH